MKCEECGKEFKRIVYCSRTCYKRAANRRYKVSLVKDPSLCKAEGCQFIAYHMGYCMRHKPA